MGFYRCVVDKHIELDDGHDYVVQVNGQIFDGKINNYCNLYDDAFNSVFGTERRLFNDTVIIGNKITNCFNLFCMCSNLNSPITIGDNVNNCMDMFRGCVSLNSPVRLGKKVYYCFEMFMGCANFNQDLIIPDTVSSCQDMLWYCNNFASNIYFKGTSYRYIGLGNMLGLSYSLTTYPKRTLYFNSVLNNVFNTGIMFNTSQSLTWTLMDNGYYNSGYNIYCYYNYDGVS